MPRKGDAFIVQERQVEDILATFTDLTAGLLGVSEPLRLLARQLALPDGSRLDLLFAAGRKLLLVELKVEACRKEFVRQIAKSMFEKSFFMRGKKQSISPLPRPTT
jgi:hypothetical protein